ncbi:MAG: glycosyltransferase [Bacteroidota bacterium]
MKPRLLIILNRLAIGGPAMNTLALASKLSEQYEILLIAGEALSHEHSADHLLNYYKGFKVLMVPEFTRDVFLWKDYKAYQKIKSIIRDFAPQIVHTHGSKPGVLGRWAAHRLGVPVIIHTFHGHVFHSYFSSIVSRMIVALERKLATYTDIIVAINSQLQHDLISTYRIADESKILLSPLGIDLEFYKQTSGADMREKIRNDFKLNNEEIAVVVIGRLVPVKHHQLFIQIASKIIKEYPHIPFRFFLVGDGPERERLIALAKVAEIKFSVGVSFDPGSQMHFLLWRKDIPALLSGMDILLHTSLNEGTPVSILEAMAMGKPVVATPVGGISGIINTSGAGFTSFNPKELTQNLILLATHPDIRKIMGEKGKLYIQQKASIEKQAVMLANRMKGMTLA